MDKKAFSYKGHMFISVFVLLIFLFINNFFALFPVDYVDTALLLCVSLLYGLLPDVDTLKSKAGKSFLMFSITLAILCFILSLSSLGIIIMLILAFFLFVKHRGIIHSILFAIIFSLPLLFVDTEYFIVGLLSYIAHLAADGKVKLV